MNVAALLMAGGKGSRLGDSQEKPLITIGGKPIIELVIRSLQDAKRVNLIVVAVSHNTPRTAAFAAKFPVKIAPTPGKGYIEDLQYLVKQLDLKQVLTIAADIPFINGRIIDEIVDQFLSCGKPALTVVTSLATKQKLGLGAEHAFVLAGKTVVPVGINAIDGKSIEIAELEQEVLLMDKPEVAVNINTLEELAIAEKLVKQV